MTRCLSVAFAMAFGFCLAPALGATSDSSAVAESPDSASLDYPSSDSIANPTSSSPDSGEWISALVDAPSESAVSRAPTSSSLPRPRELNAAPVAPLPPGLLIAPVGLATAAWMTYRIKRRRGVI